MKSRRRLRLPAYDYSLAGYYFITICTRKRIPWFGAIYDGKVMLSPPGNIVRQCWDDIPQHFIEVELDVFVIMPNHIHGIIIINDTRAGHARPLQCIVGTFKSAVSKCVRQCDASHKHFRWQRSFYDHVIRNEKSLQLIREYILYNPVMWPEDPENPDRTTPPKHDTTQGMNLHP